MKISAEKMERVDVDRLVGYARNARTHSKEQVAQLRSSLREFGFVSPVLCDKDYNIIAGHGRVMAAKEEGFAQVPCVFVEGLTDAQRKAYILADNRLALNADWDNELLSLEFSDLKDLGFDLELTGFDAKEIEKLFNENGNADVQEDDFDMTAALEEAAFVLPGDIWRVGRHTLMCGDSAIAADVERLMGGKKANLLLIDPPYNVAIKSNAGLSIMNDNLKGDEFYNFLLASFKNAYDALVGGAGAYVFHADGEKVNFYNAFVAAGFHYSTTCVWVKNALVLGRGDFNQRHEPVLYGFKDTSRHSWYSDRKQTTVWEFNKSSKNQGHPTAKPLDLIAYPITCSTQANGIVLDLFGGSGSTLIACEQTDRICFTSELDPKYASVILRRYAEFKQNFGDDITCERGGETLKYIDLVKEVEVRK